LDLFLVQDLNGDLGMLLHRSQAVLLRQQDGMGDAATAAPYCRTHLLARLRIDGVLHLAKGTLPKSLADLILAHALYLHMKSLSGRDTASSGRFSMATKVHNKPPTQQHA
jgi:hypothetical protein